MMANLVVHAFTTVGNHAEKSKSFSQIFGGLSFSCTSRASRGTTQLHTQSLSESQINSVCQWCDDQTTIQPHILVAIPKCSCNTRKESVMTKGSYHSLCVVVSVLEV